MTMLARLLHTHPGHIRGRLAWLLWRQYVFAVSKWWRQATCRDHFVGYVRVGRLADVVAGGGEPRAYCRNCGRGLGS